jgi:hypothetical protein
MAAASIRTSGTWSAGAARARAAAPPSRLAPLPLLLPMVLQGP